MFIINRGDILDDHSVTKMKLSTDKSLVIIKEDDDEKSFSYYKSKGVAVRSYLKIDNNCIIFSDKCIEFISGKYFKNDSMITILSLFVDYIKHNDIIGAYKYLSNIKDRILFSKDVSSEDVINEYLDINNINKHRITNTNLMVKFTIRKDFFESHERLLKDIIQEDNYNPNVLFEHKLHILDELIKMCFTKRSII